ncbi:MAG: hypothetical protein RL757_158 [Bacteroidota bacterium]|jgi:hypothetical protein
MKILIVMMSAYVSFFNPAPPAVNLSPITKALSEGDAAALGSFFDATIDLTVLTKQDLLDKSKATETLRQFFQSNKPKSFNAMHQGTSKGANSQYTLGDLITANGTFRVYLYYRVTGDKILIQEMRIEK